MPGMDQDLRLWSKRQKEMHENTKPSTWSQIRENKILEIKGKLNKMQSFFFKDRSQQGNSCVNYFYTKKKY